LYRPVDHVFIDQTPFVLSLTEANQLHLKEKTTWVIKLSLDYLQLLEEIDEGPWPT
jgi:hypothetical protein